MNLLSPIAAALENTSSLPIALRDAEHDRNGLENLAGNQPWQMGGVASMAA